MRDYVNDFVQKCVFIECSLNSKIVSTGYGQIQDPGQILERWWVGEVSNLPKSQENYTFLQNVQNLRSTFSQNSHDLIQDASTPTKILPTITEI